VGLGSSFVQAGGAWIAKRSEFALGDGVRQGKGIAAEHVDVLEAERRQPGNIVGQYLVPLGPELIERRIHVNGVPEHDEVDDESERTKLVLLSLAIAQAQFSTLAMKEDAGELMASFAPIELDEDASSIAVLEHTMHELRHHSGTMMGLDKAYVGFLFRCYSDPFIIRAPLTRSRTTRFRSLRTLSTRRSAP
jgi:hypothetical protein